MSETAWGCRDENVWEVLELLAPGENTSQSSRWYLWEKLRDQLHVHTTLTPTSSSNCPSHTNIIKKNHCWDRAVHALTWWIGKGETLSVCWKDKFSIYEQPQRKRVVIQPGLVENKFVSWVALNMNVVLWGEMMKWSGPRDFQEITEAYSPAITPVLTDALIAIFAEMHDSGHCAVKFSSTQKCARYVKNRLKRPNRTGQWFTDMGPKFRLEPLNHT